MFTIIWYIVEHKKEISTQLHSSYDMQDEVTFRNHYLVSLLLLLSFILFHFLPRFVCYNIHCDQKGEMAVLLVLCCSVVVSPLLYMRFDSRLRETMLRLLGRWSPAGKIAPTSVIHDFSGDAVEMTNQ